MAAQELTKTVLKDNANLKAYYRFESGALTTDSSGQSKTLTNNNTATEGTGVYGGCVTVNGTDESMSIAENLGIDGGAVTLSLWLKTTTVTSALDHLSFIALHSATTDVSYNISVGSTGLRASRLKTGVSWNDTSEKAFSSGVWTHAVLTYDATTLRLYVNGGYVAGLATSGNGSDTGSSKLTIGCRADVDALTGQIAADIDDVAVFNVALSADQIKELYEGRFIGEAYPQAGLVGGWHLNGSSTDFSGNNNHGTDTAITYSQANGKFGQGAGFNGSSSVVSLGTTINPFTGDFSLSAWIKLGATGADKTIFGKYGAGATDQWLLFYIVSTGVLSLSFYGDDLSSTKTISDTTSWHHVAATYAYGAKTKTLYIDGNQVAQANGTGNPNFGSNALLLGKLNTGTYWNGAIDEALVYNRVLTPQEIRRMYALGTGKLQ